MPPISEVCGSNKSPAIIQYSLQTTDEMKLKKEVRNCLLGSAVHSFLVLSAPTILRPWVRITSTPSMLFSIFIIEIGTKWTKILKKRPGLAHLKK